MACRGFGGGMSGLPSGTVTFLFTDLEGSTRLWEENPEAMPTALARHDGISRDAVESHGGRVVKMTGDGVHAAFPTARAAVEAAIGGQLALSSQEWAETEPCGFHGRAYGGRAASRRGLFRAESEPGGSADRHGHGGQVVLSLASEELVRSELPADVT